MSKVKNIIFIMLDTLQYNYLGCYGNEKVKTPNLDRFARSNILFENAYSEGLPTVPVRRATLTGRYTLPFGGWQPLSADDTTIPDILWGRDVQTALVYDTPPMRLPKYGYSRGFDYVKFCPGHELDHTTYKDVPLDPGMRPIDYTSYSMVYNEKGEIIDDASTALLDEIDCFLRFRQRWRSEEDNYVSVVAHEADRWLRDVRIKDRPFLLWVDSFDPHEPWDPPSVWEKKPCPHNPDWKGNPIILAPWTPVEGRITDEECEHVRALYAENIELVDRRIGMLLDSVREQGLWDETMIVIASDHGQPLGKGEHGHGIMRKCRPWPYEELVHVPLMMHLPGVEGGKRIKSFVQNVDLAPTMLDALGLYGGEGQDSGYGFPVYGCEDMQGHNLLPLIRGEVDKVRDFAIAGYYGMSWSIITEDYSYIHWILKDASQLDYTSTGNPGKESMKDEAMWSCTAGAKQEVPDSDELYDRRKDPHQLNNIIGDNKEKAEELLRMLKLYIGELKTL
ncbi:sulfatase [uncultured Desulfovibrio sp.]|uniref:sulfatase n=1 Tax=uncultured Desulfovibrio sp. TaxID=167968 RepID=UPI00260EE0DF|nr:sulfatase [uncultured Desulfovibrio sp.]